MFLLQLTCPQWLWATPALLAFEHWQEALFDGVVDYGNLTEACESLGLNRTSVYRFARQNPDFDKKLRQAQRDSAWCRYDDSNRIVAKCAQFVLSAPADVNTNAYVAAVRLQVDHYHRQAGKLVQHLMDKPTMQVNVDNRQVIVSEEKRSELQDRLARLQLANKPGGEK